jgi:hypothetical protein
MVGGSNQTQEGENGQDRGCCWSLSRLPIEGDAMGGLLFPIPSNPSKFSSHASMIHNHPSSVFHRPSSTTRQLQLLASPPFAIPTQRRPQLGCGKVLGHFTRPSDCAPATDVTCLGFSSSKNCLMASIPRTSRETGDGNEGEINQKSQTRRQRVPSLRWPPLWTRPRSSN